LFYNFGLQRYGLFINKKAEAEAKAKAKAKER